MLRGVVLAGGVIAGLLLASGLASASADDSPAAVAAISVDGRSDGPSLLPLGSGLPPLGADLTQVVSAVAPPVLPQVDATVQVADVVTSAQADPASALRPAAPVASDAGRPVAGGAGLPAAVPAVPAVSVVRDLAGAVAQPAGSASTVRAGHRLDRAEARAAGVPAPSPWPTPDPTPTRLDMPCAPAPALPAPASQPSTVNAVEALPAAQPSNRCIHIRMARGGGSPTISIAEEPGSTPD